MRDPERPGESDGPAGGRGSARSNGTRMIVVVNPADMRRLGLNEGEAVTLAAAVGDQVTREVAGLRVAPYDRPEGCVAACHPECNPLIPLGHHAARSKVPAARSVPVPLPVQVRKAGSNGA